MKKAIRFFCVGIVTLGLILLTAERNFAAGPKYPIKPIQVVVAFAPGGTDVNLRPFIDKMPEYLGQPMTFVYKPGAAGALGAGLVTTSKPDGYTILGSTQSAMVVIPHTQKGVNYTLDAFAPICNLTESYPILWVQSNARWNNLPELVAEAKKNPGMISFTSPGTLAIQHLLVEAFAKEAGIKLNHIPAQGGATVITALLGGHVDMAVQDIVTGLPHVQAGTLRPLGVFSPKRTRALPNAPTISEQGYPVDTPMLYGLVGPKDLPKDIVEALSSAAKKVYEKYKPSLIESYDKLGAEIHYLAPEEYGAELRRQNVFFAKIVKELNQ
jgi:tripartite-type tricarboxylate transporter receptor subunit TctC